MDVVLSPANRAYAAVNGTVYRIEADNAPTPFFIPGSGGLTGGVGQLTFGPAGNLYGLNNNAVLRFNGRIGALLGKFVAAGSGGLGSPFDLAFLNGKLLVTDYSDTIRQYNAGGAYAGNFATLPGYQLQAIAAVPEPSIGPTIAAVATAFGRRARRPR